MGHVKTFLARWQHHRFSPSRTQLRGGRSAFVNSGRTDGRIRTGPSPFDAPKHRNDDGMRHVALHATWHVPRAAARTLTKTSAGTKFSKGRLQRPQTCRVHAPWLWHTYHVSDDPKGSKYCPQGAISFFSLMPFSSDTLGPRVTKFGTQVEANKGYPYL